MNCLVFFLLIYDDDGLLVFIFLAFLYRDETVVRVAE